MRHEANKTTACGGLGDGKGENEQVGAAVTSFDRLEYMADIVLDLKQMAESSGCVTLAAILGLAYVEATQQCERVRK